MKDHSSYLKKRMVCGGRSLIPEILSQPHWSENADFQSIFAGSTSAVTPSEKVQLTLIGRSLRAFQ